MNRSRTRARIVREVIEPGQLVPRYEVETYTPRPGQGQTPGRRVDPHKGPHAHDRNRWGE